MLGISFDSETENAMFAEKFDFPYRLLCDTDKSVGLAYGAADNADAGYPARITYVIGPDGKIAQAIDTEDPGGQADAILASL